MLAVNVVINVAIDMVVVDMIFFASIG